MYEPVAVLLLAAASAAGRPPAPEVDCLDARSISGVWRIFPDQLLVRSAGRRFRLQFSAACEADPARSVLLAREGWVCGRGGEFLQSGTQRCSVAGVHPINAIEFRQALAQAHHARPVAGDLRDALAGHVGRCFDPGRVRAWSLQGDSVVVQTSAVGTGGRTRYRVSFSGACPEAGILNEVVWKPVAGLIGICGVPGEYAVFGSQHKDVALLARSFLAGRESIPAERGCAIERVEPLIAAN
ncbi:MAG: hypothetical protein IT479_04355 [Xanthomonadales bacterium]|nr:hypothetical protein [Xanthomonadales bacterium]MCC6592485.1 hypothetical protein [Xanthomonadales bacterium]